MYRAIVGPDEGTPSRFYGHRNVRIGAPSKIERKPYAYEPVFSKRIAPEAAGTEKRNRNCTEVHGFVIPDFGLR
eukprot:5929575-Alexandrium_andersonii.AAC.1